MESFAERIYRELKKVPKGKVTTYKELAKAVGTRAYRAVGMALSKNPYAPEVACHRVVTSSGRIGGFMGQKHGEKIDKKINMLKREGIEFVEDRVKNFEEVMFRL